MRWIFTTRAFAICAATVCSICVFWGAPGYAQSYLPSVKIGTAAPIAPSAADAYYGSSATSTNGLGATSRPPEIVDLARSLKNNPDLIYEYVRNNIEVVWLYGLQKGALGAAIDKSGTTFDQAMLMVELLRQSGYTAAYQAGTVTLDATGFYNWTGISDAKAACQLLSSGGIPAQVNGSSQADCGYPAGTAISSITLSHIWVAVTINGGTYLFDPSYKPHGWKTGIDLTAATGLSSGTPLSQATSGMDSGTNSGASYVHNLNTEALNSTLQTYSSNLLSYLQSHNLQAAEMEDIVGGGLITPFATPSGGLRQSALPYTASAQHNWSGNIPDKYRTTLAVSGTIGRHSGGGHVDQAMFAQTFFADEIYGRKLTIDTDYGPSTTNCEQLTTPCSVYLKLDGQALATYSTIGVLDLPGTITLTANHPYAAATDGTATTSGNYMDATLSKTVYLITPLTIVHGWGDTGPNLLKKWSNERATDKVTPIAPGGGEYANTSIMTPRQGDFTREKTAASWLSQFTQEAKLNANIGKSVFQLHHVLGVVYADVNINGSYPTTSNCGLTTDGDGNSYTAPCYFGDPNFAPLDSVDRIDVDSAVSLTSKSADSNARRSTLLSIAASSAALEGSISQQMADLPDSASTATRFGWGNRPPSAEDPSGAGARAFFQFDNTNASTASNLLVTEGQSTSTCNMVYAVSGTQPCANADYRSPVVAEIASYATAGFQVVASRETFLGPGQRGGSASTNQARSCGCYTYQPTKQRGGAFVATRYVNGDPVEIAHIVSSISALGATVFTKGGGGGIEPNQNTAYNPSQAADILKSRFVDRSNVEGVSLANGSVSITQPVALQVGNGEFPYQLTAKLEWNSTSDPGDYPLNPVPPQPGMTTNWNNSLAMSSSGSEAMGASDVRAAVGTIAAFLVTQDIYKSAPSPQRDVAAVLAQSWWTNQISGNSVTVRVGSSARQFAKVPSGQWIALGAGAYATLTQSGTRAPYEVLCGVHLPYALSRGWDYSNMSFDVTNAHGDVQHFPFFRNRYMTSDTDNCGFVQGFRLSTWSFPQGVTVSLNYGQAYMGASTSAGIEQLLSVSNSLGRTINFVNDGAGTITGFNNGLSGSDARSISVATTSAGAVTTTSITDQAGAAWRYIYRTQALSRPYTPFLIGQVYSPNNTSAPHIQYVYDNDGRVTEVDDANNLQLANRNPYYFYIADGTRGERVDPLGASYTVVYDTKGRPWRYLDELNRETDATFDGRGRVVSYSYPEQDCEIFAYDDHNNSTSITKVDKASACNPSAGSGHVLSISANWDQTWNKPLSVTDARGNTSTFSYFSSGNGGSLIQTATRPNNGIYSFTYNSFGKVLTQTDPTNLVTSNVYDSTYGNLLSASIDPTGVNATSSFTYNAQGDVIATDGPRTDVVDDSYTTYDVFRRPVFKIGTDPDGTGPHPRVASKSIYDAEGREIETDKGTTSSTIGADFAASLVTTTNYDPVGNKTKVATPTSITQYSYDGDDHVLCTGLRMNRDASGVFGALPSNACTLSTATIYGPDRIAKNIYDAAGQVRQVIRSLGVSGEQSVYANYKYSPNGKQIVVADADKMAGDHIGVSYTDGLNENAASDHQTNFFYDAFDRLKTTMFSDSTYEQLGYDENGNVVSKRNRAGQTISYTFDSINMQTAKSVPAVGSIAANTVSSTYDLAGRLVTVSDTLGNVKTNSFDTMKRVTSAAVTIPGLSSSRTISYLYDMASNRVRLTWPDGYYVIYAYNAANRLTGAVDSGSSTLAGYEYDDLGRQTLVQYAGNGANVSSSWSAEDDLLTLTHALPSQAHYVDFTDHYTPAKQISDSTITNAAFQYVPTTSGTDSYVANGLNQYASVKGVSLTYDASGNLTGDGIFAYSYDPENHLMTATKSGQSAAYAYDPQGRRTAKTVNSTATYFLSSGGDEISEYDGAGALLRRYVPGPGVDQPIAMVTAAGVKSFFHQDKTGSVIAMTDASGNLAEGPYTYDPFGNCLVGGQACSGGVPYKYTGRRFDPETGLYYYRARYYSAALGRFLQTDPIGYKDDINWYAYVGNDPTDRVDPTGMVTTCTGSGSNVQCTMTADTFSAAHSNGQTSVASPDVRAAADAGKGQVAVPSGNSEKLGFVVKGADGKSVVQTAGGAKTGSTSTGNTVSAKIPAGAEAVIHGHIDSGYNKSNGMVDDPKSNGGYGDTQPLRAGLPTATVSNGQVGWHEIKGGQLQFTFPGGALTPGQGNQMQQNLNNEQQLFQVP